MTTKWTKMNSNDAEDQRLLLRGLLSGRVRYEQWDAFRGEVCCGGLRYLTQVRDGIPDLTGNMREAIKQAIGVGPTT